jgi:hypothetical protein
MVRDVKSLPFDATYNDLNTLLLDSPHRTFPIVDKSSKTRGNTQRTAVGSVEMMV